MDNYENGRRGENAIVDALRQQIIPNHRYWVNPCSSDVPDENPAAVNKTNQINGDVLFVSNNCRVEFIDAKNGNWISEQSLSYLRSDAFVAFNAYYHQAETYIVRMNSELKAWIRTNIEPSRRVSDGDGYQVLWKDLPSFAECLDFDKEAYKNLIIKNKIANGELAP